MQVGRTKQIVKDNQHGSLGFKIFPLLKDYQSHHLRIVILLRDINPLGAVSPGTNSIISPAVVHDAFLRDSFPNP